MKYITTDKHPELKEGIILEEKKKGTNEGFRSLAGWVYLVNNDIIPALNCGYIKEVEEKEFTKSDIFEFCLYYYGTQGIVNQEDIKKYFKKWKGQKEK